MVSTYHYINFLGGPALYKIVDRYATNQTLTVADFMTALGKMLENGYEDGELRTIEKEQMP